MYRVLIFALLLVSTYSGTHAQIETDSAESLQATVFKSPLWGCCGAWSDYLEKNGIEVKAENVRDLGAVKSRYRVPRDLQSCHTAIVNGYIVEGHVPVEEIRRLVAEKPDILGIAVPGMPIGSPGMEVAGRGAQPYAVIAFDKLGRREVFASYPK